MAKKEENIIDAINDYSEKLGYGSIKQNSPGVKLAVSITGLLIAFSGWFLAFKWFGWRLAVVLFLLFWAGNIERRNS